jgi:hypothetical protein
VRRMQSAAPKPAPPPPGPSSHARRPPKTALRLTLAHGALHVAHDEAVLVIKELHAHLGHLQSANQNGTAFLVKKLWIFGIYACMDCHDARLLAGRISCLLRPSSSGSKGGGRAVCLSGRRLLLVPGNAAVAVSAAVDFAIRHRACLYRCSAKHFNNTTQLQPPVAGHCRWRAAACRRPLSPAELFAELFAAHPRTAGPRPLTSCCCAPGHGCRCGP